MKTYRIRKDDKVMVIAGKDKGKVGKILKILPKRNAVLVEKVNQVKRHTKANPYAKTPGGIIEKEAPLQLTLPALPGEEDPVAGKQLHIFRRQGNFLLLA